jgi:hypothetical protein
VDRLIFDCQTKIEKHHCLFFCPGNYWRGFVKRLEIPGEGWRGIIRGVVPRQAPAETFDEPAPRQPMWVSLALALIIPDDFLHKNSPFAQILL